MKVVAMGVAVGGVRRMIVVVVVLLLLLLSGVRESLQEHVLRRNRAERNKTSPGAEGEDRQRKMTAAFQQIYLGKKKKKPVKPCERQICEL